MYQDMFGVKAFNSSTYQTVNKEAGDFETFEEKMRVCSSEERSRHKYIIVL